VSDPHQNQPAASNLLAARQAAAEARVKAALDCIQEAQMLLGHAAQALCSVKGMAAEWRKVGKRYDQVHGTWYVVEQKAATLRARRRLVLDHEPNAHECEWAEERLS
jgi:hypothetical protein